MYLVELLTDTICNLFVKFATIFVIFVARISFVLNGRYTKKIIIKKLNYENIQRFHNRICC